MREIVAVAAVALVAGAAAIWRFHETEASPHYTGFVEGEERILRSEVSGRVLEVLYREGDAVPAGAVVAQLDDRDLQARLATRGEELAVYEAEIAGQRERIALVESTWSRDVSAREAELAQAEAAAELAERTFAREDRLVRAGVSTAQRLDETRAGRDQARSALARAREMLARARAEQRQIALARHELAALEQKRDLARAQLDELRVIEEKYQIRAPATDGVVQTQYIWPGELAQPGTAVLAVIDPRDKFVQIYIPVHDLARVRAGNRVEIELDSAPGRRVPGEVAFVADKASFTPEKIETRGDRMGQVYRAKVRILERAEELAPGSEGNVYLLPQPLTTATSDGH